jgi:hypothetical protein
LATVEGSQVCEQVSTEKVLQTMQDKRLVKLTEERKRPPKVDIFVLLDVQLSHSIPIHTFQLLVYSVLAMF